MFTRIMVPVDLAHADRLSKALKIAADIAKDQGAEVIYVGVGQSTPSAVAHTPEEYKDKLNEFAVAEGVGRHIKAGDHVVISHDPSVDLGDKLVKAVKEVGADLVVMASHLPGLADHIFHSNAGYVASHAPCSVYVIR